MEKREDLRWIWLLVMAATVGCIWQQSTLPPASSAALSSTVFAWIEPILGGEDSLLGAFFARFIRKIAHFTEYAILGAEGEGFLRGRRTLRLTLASLSFGALVGALDETIQIFTGRGPAFLDVLIDLAGYAFAILLVRTLSAAVALFKRYRKDKAARLADKEHDV